MSPKTAGSTVSPEPARTLADTGEALPLSSSSPLPSFPPPPPASGTPLPRRVRLLEMSRRVALVALYPVYPVLILGGLYFGSPRAIALILLAVFWLQRMLHARGLPAWIAEMTAVDWSVVVMLTLGSLLTAVTDSELALRCYPALVNVGLLVSFGVTLVRPPSMIERFARLHFTEITPRVAAHTRRVTQLWCAMFMLNGLLSVYTAVACSREVWAAFNGLISYLLVGTLIVGEWVYRRLFIKPHVLTPEQAESAR
jgi:uncharacterized membrane protein